ncbi:hypothetical protein EYF80_040040 [Liparis tanakae]|uniref:Uncharacterized protein n=1 Tax=Liparis tanakae TaxID=230148 RepID=A0A4Z2G8C1_9TELE|nr:hypothetical protein EYF80_040040 [Liparis tanakae]
MPKERKKKRSDASCSARDNGFTSRNTTCSRTWGPLAKRATLSARCGRDGSGSRGVGRHQKPRRGVSAPLNGRL